MPHKLRLSVKNHGGINLGGEDVVSESFGDLIRSNRRRLGKSLQEVADALGVTAVYISEVERGKRPPFVTGRLEKLAEVIGVDYGVLISAAWRQRKMIDIDPSSSEKQIKALAALARGGYSDAQLDVILEMAQGKEREGSSRKQK